MGTLLPDTHKNIINKFHSLCLAIVLFNHAKKLIILDEPVAGLDPITILPFAPCQSTSDILFIHGCDILANVSYIATSPWGHQDAITPPETKIGNTNTACTETLLVIDATTGQNGISQAKAFKEITDITGIVLTKLDGTAKGGIVLAIKESVGIPVKFIGLGEGMNDLKSFDIEEYIYGLFKDMM